MSRRANRTCRPRESFPRVSGDEPTYLIDTNANIEFSPRERG